MHQVSLKVRYAALLMAAALIELSAVHGQSTKKERGVRPEPRPASDTSASAGPYYALVIGNDNYRHLAKLQTAVNDAKDVAQLLRDRFNFQTKTLYNGTRAQILEAIDSYRDLPETSNLLIYYGGHGWKDIDAHRAYWLPVDAEEHQRPNWINSTDITDGVRAIKARHILVIADSCFSGDLMARAAGGAITAVERGALVAKMLSMKSRHIMSSGSDEPVSDSGPHNHSVFAAALLASLNDMEEDAFSGEDLFSRKIRPRVAGTSSQTPQYAMLRDSDADLGDFVFFRSKNGASKNVGTDATLPITSGTLLEAKKYYTAKQYDQALPLLRSAAEAGNGEAARYLGSIYETGLGGSTRDAAQAVFWYRKAADTGDAIAMNYLGYAYETGQGGLARDDVQAVRWYRKAADAGYPLGMNHLGYMYETGKGGLAKDEVQAVRLYRKAANAGEPHAMTNLAHAYEAGRGGLAKNEVQAATWYRKAAGAQEPAAMTNLGHMYETGRGGLPKDDMQAVSWYREAADAGNNRAMANLGVLYQAGRGGLPKDDMQAVNWYRKAADAGEPRAMTDLGLMYENGQGGLPRDDAQAVTLYRKAADAGDLAGMARLGNMYHAGRGGLTPDDAQAIVLYRKAAAAGDSTGMNYLGYMYEHGFGVAKDLTQAAIWYRKAAALGNSTAKDAMDRLRPGASRGTTKRHEERP